MKRRSKTVILAMIGLSGALYASLFLPQKDAFAARETSDAISVTIENEMASADIRGVTVAKIIQRLEKECAVRFFADESILNEIISVQFSNLPLQAGMMKIFSGMNYIFYFQPAGTLIEVALLGKKGLQPAQGPSRLVEAAEDAPKTETHAGDERPAYRPERGILRGAPPRR